MMKLLFSLLRTCLQQQLVDELAFDVREPALNAVVLKAQSLEVEAE